MPRKHFPLPVENQLNWIFYTHTLIYKEAEEILQLLPARYTEHVDRGRFSYMTLVIPETGYEVAVQTVCSRVFEKMDDSEKVRDYIAHVAETAPHGNQRRS